MRLTLLLLSSLLLSSAALLASDKNTEWNGRIEQASAKANIFALPSFEMKADVEVEDSGKSLHGDYTLLWNGADQWKEEISFPGYSETQVGKKGVLSIKRSQDFVPLRIGQLHSTLGYGSGTQPGSFFNQAPRSNERVTKVRRRKVDGRKADCVEIANQANLTREACIDQSSGTFARAEVFAGIFFHDADAMPVGSKLFPRHLTFVDRGKVVAAVQITRVESGVQLSQSLFETPAGAISRPGCMNPVPGRLVSSGVTNGPGYSAQDLQSHVQGTVAVYLTIDKNGTPQDLHLVSSLSPGLDKASLDEVRQFRYEPATCNGTPVDIETVIEMHYETHYLER